jgi:uncharacterized membrane protein YgcG
MPSSNPFLSVITHLLFWLRFYQPPEEEDMCAAGDELSKESAKQAIIDLRGTENANTMLGIREAKGLEFPDVILVNFFCRHETVHISDAAIDQMIVHQGYTGSLNMEEVKSNPALRKRFDSARRDAKRALDAQVTEDKKRRKARQKAWKWLLSQHHSDPPPIPREIEVDLKLLYTAISRCSNRMYFVETVESEAGAAWKKWLLAKALATCAAEEDYDIADGNETDRERRYHHKSRGLELAAVATDGAEDGESSDLFEQAAASFHAAGESKLEERVRIQAESYRSNTAEWTADQLVQHVTELVQRQLPVEAVLLCDSWAEEMALSADEGLDISLARALSGRLRSFCDTCDERTHLTQPSLPMIGSITSAAPHGTISRDSRSVNASDASGGNGGGGSSGGGSSGSSGGSGGGSGGSGGSGIALRSKNSRSKGPMAEGQADGGQAGHARSYRQHSSAAQAPTSPCCTQCGVGSTDLQRCGRCQATMYCGPQCQRAHWKAGHKHECAQFVN